MPPRRCALEIAGVGAAAVGDAVDPEAAFGVDVLAVGLELELGAVDRFEVFGVAGDLPGELAALFAAGGGELRARGCRGG